MASRSTSAVLLRVDEAAERLAISRATAYRLIQRGELATIHIGAAVRVPVAALDAWVAAHIDGEWQMQSGSRRTTGRLACSTSPPGPVAGHCRQASSVDLSHAPTVSVAS